MQNKNKIEPPTNIQECQETLAADCNIRYLIDMTEDNNKKSEDEEEYDLKSHLKDWCIRQKITRVACDELLSILLKGGFDVPTSSKTLLGTKYNQIVPIEMTPGHYFHFGLEKSLNSLNLRMPLETTVIYIDIGIDGLPLFKSSNATLWPIMGSIATCHNIKPFLIGAYLGPSKPRSTNEYLDEFVKEVQSLHSRGMVINERVMQLRIRLFVCDTPARAFVTGAVGHTSSHGCPRCKQIAKNLNNRLAYTTSSGDLISDEEFKNR